MDLDAFVDAHAAQWARLDRLSRRRRLTAAEADELVALYERVGTQLSVLRSAAPDPALVGRLSSLVARARAAVTGGSEPAWRELARFFAVSFPAALYRTRRWWLACAGGTLLVSTALAWWVASHPQVQAAVASDDQVRALVEHDFADYYREYAAGSFAAQVWTNNAWIAALCIATGVLGLPVLWILLQNAVNLGVVAGLMASRDRLDLFFGLVTPHGLLELTAVFVAAGTGLRLCWSWVDPGPLPRARSLAREGRAAAGVALGLVLVLAVSGAVEAFVTPSGLPTWARIGVGVAVELVFLGYVLVLGRAAVRAGESGDLEEQDAGAVLPVA